MNTGSILLLRKGKTIPEALRKKLLENCRIAVGYAAVAESSVLMETMDDADVKIEESIDSVCETCREVPLAFYFDAHKEIMGDDMQPFPIIADGDNVILAAMLEGEFPNWVGDGTHTVESNLVREFLSEACKELYQESGEDIDAFMKEANETKFRRTVNGVLMPRGALLLVPSKGEPVLFTAGIMQTGGTGATLDCGWCTNAFGYTEKAADAPTTATGGKQKTKMEELKERMEANAKKKAAAEADPAGPTAPPSVPVVPPAANPPAVTPGKTDTAVPKTNGELMIKCPKDIKDKAREQWIKRNLIKERHFTKGWANDDMAYPQSWFRHDAPALAGALRTADTSFVDAAKKVDAQDKGAVAPKAKDAPADVTTLAQPVMSPKTKEHGTNLIKDGTLAVDKRQFTEIERPYDSFTEQLQIGEDAPLFYLYDAYITLAQADVNLTACLLEQFRRRILKMDPTIEGKMKARMEQAGKTPEGAKPDKMAQLKARMEAAQMKKSA